MEEDDLLGPDPSQERDLRFKLQRGHTGRRPDDLHCGGPDYRQGDRFGWNMIV